MYLCAVVTRMERLLLFPKSSYRASLSIQQTLRWRAWGTCRSTGDGICSRRAKTGHEVKDRDKDVLMCRTREFFAVVGFRVTK